MNPILDDPLAGLGEKPQSASHTADRWGSRLLKLTLFCLMLDIGLVIAFSLMQAGVLAESWLAPLLAYWEWLAYATVLGLVGVFLCAILKMSYELTEH